MEITNETELTVTPVMFMDGEKGMFLRQEKLLANGENTGVLVATRGNTYTREYERTFVTKQGEFHKLDDAFASVGHTVNQG